MSCDKAREMITGAYNMREVDECIVKFVPLDLRNDFKQELFLKLLQIPCDKIIDVRNMKHYAVRIIINLIRQKRDVYHKTYLDGRVDYDTDKVLYESLDPAEHDTIGDRQQREQREQDILLKLDNLDAITGSFYHRELIMLIVQTGSVEQASKRLGIPKSSIWSTVKKVRKHLTQ